MRSRKGPNIVNKTGGRCYATLCSLTVLAPANNHSRIWSEAQTGPATPVAIYDDIYEPVDWVARSERGLQCALLFGYDDGMIGRLVDALAYHVGRNAPDQRGPDVFPLTERGNSTLGILNATERLTFFPVPTTVAAKMEGEKTVKVLESLNQGQASFRVCISQQRPVFPVSVVAGDHFGESMNAGFIGRLILSSTARWSYLLPVA